MHREHFSLTSDERIRLSFLMFDRLRFGYGNAPVLYMRFAPAILLPLGFAAVVQAGLAGIADPGPIGRAAGQAPKPGQDPADTDKAQLAHGRLP
jgi:hypothetical protein